MAKLKLPFELEKPSANEYVTQASEIGYKGRSLEESIDKVLKDVRCDSETINIGDYVYDTGNARIGKKTGESTFSYRLLSSIPNGEGRYIYRNSINESFIFEVINHVLVCVDKPSIRNLAGYGNPARNTVRAYDLYWDKSNHIVRDFSFSAGNDSGAGKLFVDDNILYCTPSGYIDPIIVNESLNLFASGEKVKNVNIGNFLPTPADDSLVKGGAIYPLIDKVLKDIRYESEVINVGDYVYDTNNARIGQKTGESTYSYRSLSSIPDGEGRYVYRNSINELFIFEVINHVLVCVDKPSIRKITGLGNPTRTDVRAFDLYWDKTNNRVREVNWGPSPVLSDGQLVTYENDGLLYCTIGGSSPKNPLVVAGLNHEYHKYITLYPFSKCETNLYNHFFLAFREVVIFNAPKNVKIGVGRIIVNSDNFCVEFMWDGMSTFESVSGCRITINFSDTGIMTYPIEVSTGMPYSGYVVVDTSLIDKTYITSSRSNLYNNVQFDCRVAKGKYGQLLVPSKYYVLVNRRFRICSESLIANKQYNCPALEKGTDYVSIYESAQTIYSPSPLIRTDIYHHIYTDVVENKRVVISYVNNGVVADKKLTYFNAITKSQHSGSLKVLIIGDSRTEKDTKQLYVNEQNQNDVMHIEWVGTHGNSTTKSEGYSGRNLIDVCTSPTLNNFTNYFYDETISGDYKFSLEHYVQTTEIVPDVIIIDHGFNQSNLDWSTQLLPAYNFIIADVAAYNQIHNTEIKIVIAIQDGGSFLEMPNQAGAIKRQKAPLCNHGQEMLAAFDNREEDGIYVLPEYMNVDGYNDYPYGWAHEENNESAKFKVCFDGVHPGTQSFPAFSSSKAYNVGERMEKDDKYYGCWKPTNAGETPTTNPDKWIELDSSIGAGYRNIGEIYYVYLHYIAREIYGE